MSYQVPKNIDPNKVFLVNYSDLEGRLDPLFYTSQFVAITNALKENTSYKLLGQVVKFSNEFWNQKEYYEERFPYIEIGAIDITDGTIREMAYIPVEEAPSRAKVIVRTNDIIISTTRPGRGAIAKITEHENNYIVSTGFSVIRKIDDCVNREYLFSILRLDILLKQMIQRSTGGNYPAITQEELSKIVVPIPSKAIQDRIVSIMQVALFEKQQKEKQAEDLLNGIDDYLLGELGVILPKQESQALLDRVFTVNFSEICNGRFDPKLYSISVKQLQQSLYMSPFDKQPLKNFIKSNCSGEWGKDESEEVDDNKYTKCLVIRATEFDNTYNLRLDNSRIKYRWIENSKLSRMNILPNDLLIEKSGGSEDQPVGRISILTDDILKNNTIAYSNFIHKITVEGINPMYLYFYLKTMHNIKITDSMQSQTNGIRNLIMQEFFNQTIVVPSPEKQQEIVNHITAIRQQAKALQEEGKAILEKAKKEVEEMILG